jgi:hypothetical protein
MGVDIGIPDDRRTKVIDILSTRLADEFLLYAKTRNYHWNAAGRPRGAHPGAPKRRGHRHRSAP